MTEYSETVPAGIIISTDPAAGERILRGSSMLLVVSMGPERYPMPTVVGEQLDAAEALLTTGNLALGEVTEQWSEEAPNGQVLSASQDAGTQLKPDTPVNLVVSAGREPIRIPDHVGGQAAAAQEELGGLGFEVEVTEEHHAEIPAGVVIRQDPREGTGHRGDTVTIVRSLGPVMVEIPSVRLLSADEATRKLEDLDLRVKVERNTDFPIPLDIASGTDPGEGESVPVGTEVTLFVA